jgi:uncharacterized protein (DUF362 family)/Pyruvate/2-oxoacid:ferredoxin oxidoreductase delta subunit
MRHNQTTIVGWPPHEPSASAPVGTSRCISYNLQDVRRAVNVCIAELPDMQDLFARADRVLLKPNLLSASRMPDDHVNTHPAVVQAVAEVLVNDFRCKLAIGDSCGTMGDGSTSRAIKNSGVEDVARLVGADVYNVDSQARRMVDIPNARVLKKVPLPANLDQFDLIVSLPKFKTHMLTLLTGAVKNMLGLVPAEAKKEVHVQAPRPDEFAVALCDLYTAVKPQAAIIDGIIAMEGAGPANGKLRHLEMLAASCDPVALDSFCALVAGIEPLNVPLLAECHQRGVGVAASADLRVRGEDADAFALPDFARPPTYANSLGAKLVPRWMVQQVLRSFGFRYAHIDQEKCKRCGECARNCPNQAITIDHATGRYSVNRQACISCFCCAEVCPHDAISVRYPWSTRVLQRVRSAFHG